LVYIIMDGSFEQEYTKNRLLSEKSGFFGQFVSEIKRQKFYVSTKNALSILLRILLYFGCGARNSLGFVGLLSYLIGFLDMKKAASAAFFEDLVKTITIDNSRYQDQVEGA
jgi:hypothetical protein